ncbi:MAG: hypothetical protein JW910_05220, partial [Anaerolineae bacterium]|nr:hypothetical protein [Anaerolineae bacterium]
LSGSPTFTRCESTINYDWTSYGPGGGLGSDNFAVRWTGRFAFGGGTYTFIARADDGIRLWVDGALLIDQWHDTAVTEYRANRSLAAGEHDVKVEYYENTYEAVAQVRWETVSASCPTGQYRAEYFNNRYLSGSPAFTRCESSINTDWGVGGPGGGVGSDNFSVRWTGRFVFGAGTYTFIARADDGIRLWVDGVQIINQWQDQAPTEYRVNRSLTAGEHEVKVSYYENAGGAVAQVRWEAVSATCPVGQYLAEYFNNRYLSGSPTFTRCETAISYDWGVGGPGAGIGGDSFSVRWTGRFYFGAGTYTFIARADDGIRLWVDGALLIDQWKDQSPTEYRANRGLSAGEHDVKVEYYENAGGAVAQVRWETTSGLCGTGQYRAEYFNNRTLSGSPTFTRCEPSINYDWAVGGPGGGVGVDNFSVRWTGRFVFGAGTYTFIARADDGIRLWVDGVSVISQWHDQAPTEYRADRSLSAGEHEIKVEYYENAGGAVAQVRWEPTSGVCSTNQYRAEYFNNRTLSGTPAFSRCESSINYDWGVGGPGGGVGVDNFSVRWTGRFGFNSGSHTFIARADDGIRLWVDGALLIDQWRDQPPTEFRATRTLSAGEHEIKVEHYENTGGAVAQVWWERTSASCAVGQYLAQYYDNRTLSGSPIFTRCETSINYDWGLSGPVGGAVSDNFSVRWSGRFWFGGGTRTFIAYPDDGMRVWVDTDLIFDKWQDQSAKEHRFSHNVSAGEHEVTVEYYEHGNAAVAKFRWE